MAGTADGPLASQGVVPNHVLTSTILTLTWVFSTLCWSIFTPPHWTFAARTLLVQPLWIVRACRNDATWLQDVVLFEIIHAIYTCWSGAWMLPNKSSLGFVDLTDRNVRVYLQVFTLLGACGLWAGVIVYRGQQISSADEGHELLHKQTIDEQVLPPLLLTSRTNHSRLIPTKNSFSYCYLYVGIPVGVQGRISTVLSVDSQKRGWFSVSSADHLDRDDGRDSLAVKLKRYLHTQGVTDRDYAFAYLITAPRFAGYNFNPVSFWYLYDSDTHLKYMVLEVNNTFDERRLYLLRGDRSGGSSAADDEGDAKRLVFSEAWQKDFHVSPFNSRKGSYSLRALDPLAHYEDTGQVRIDNTIILRSSKDSPKVVARVFSEGEPKDPVNLSTLDLAKFIASWWWVGFATFPRIVWEAGKLFFRRKLHVWYRPEIVATSLGRAYSNDEKLLETFFRAFLARTVSEAIQPLRVVYEPAHNAGAEVVMYSPGFTYEEDHQRTLTIKVLSPVFYSRFVHYAHTSEAFDRECLSTDERNRTVSIKRPELLTVLLTAMHDQSRPSEQRSIGLIERARWSWFQPLRCPPAVASYSSTTTRAEDSHVTDIRSFKMSELDAFVRHHCDDADLYRRIVTKTFLAERLALGLLPLLVAMDLSLRAALLLISMLYSDNCYAVDILRPRPFVLGDLGTFGVTTLLANTVHLWSFLKG